MINSDDRITKKRLTCRRGETEERRAVECVAQWSCWSGCDGAKCKNLTLRDHHACSKYLDRSQSVTAFS